MKQSALLLVTSTLLFLTAMAETTLAQVLPPPTKKMPAVFPPVQMEWGQDLVSLLQQGKVEIQTWGSGISSVGIRVRRLVPQQITVSIPTGIVFVGRNPGSQTMVITGGSSVSLSNDQWFSFSAPAACANRALDIPKGEDRFTVRRTQNKALAKVLPVLAKSGESFAVRQAVVWILAEDANYDDLATLIRASDRSRMIREYEANRALEICQQAGIDMTGYRIWIDRYRFKR